MKKTYLWQSVAVGLIPLVVLLLVWAVFLVLGSDTVWDLHRLTQAAPLAAAFLGGCIAGFRRRKKGLLSGIAVSFCLWLFLAAVLCWFLPRIMGTWIFLILPRMLAAGILGGLCGVNLPKKPKPKTEG